MKRILIICLLVFTATCAKSQKWDRNDTAAIHWDRKWGISNSQVPEMVLWVDFKNNDTTIGLRGDTIAVIKRLYLLYEKTRNEFDEFVAKSVKFSNNTPDYYRTRAGNCGWPEYNRLLSKYGYYVEKIKGKKQKCY